MASKIQFIKSADDDPYVAPFLCDVFGCLNRAELLAMGSYVCGKHVGKSFTCGECEYMDRIATDRMANVFLGTSEGQ